MNTLNIKEAAVFLKIHEQTARRFAKAGIIPAAKPGKHWCFIEEDLRAYLRSMYTPQPQMHHENPKDVIKWPSTKEKIPGTGGPVSQRQADSRYESLLGLPTKNPPKNTKTD